MGWVYLDDRFPEHPKVEAAGDEAGWLFVCGLAYVNRNTTGGTIPKTKVPKLTGLKNPARLATALVRENLWEDKGDSYLIHDYEDWNRSAIDRKDKARKAAEARWKKPKPDATEHTSSNAQASPEHVPKEPPSIARSNAEAMHNGMPSPKPLFPTPPPSSVLTTTVVGPKTADDDDRSQEPGRPKTLLDQALHVLARRRLDTNPNPVGNVPAWLASVVNRLKTELAERIGDTDLTQFHDPTQLADWFEPPPKPVTPKYDPIVETQRARQAKDVRNEWEPCAACDSRNGQAVDDHGDVHWCPQCTDGTGPRTRERISA